MPIHTAVHMPRVYTPIHTTIVYIQRVFILKYTLQCIYTLLYVYPFCSTVMGF